MSSRFGKGLTPISNANGPIARANEADDEVREDKQTIRDRIQSDIERFLSSGGCVQSIPTGYGVLDFGAGVKKALRVVK